MPFLFSFWEHMLIQYECIVFAVSYLYLLPVHAPLKRFTETKAFPSGGPDVLTKSQHLVVPFPAAKLNGA